MTTPAKLTRKEYYAQWRKKNAAKCAMYKRKYHLSPKGKATQKRYQAKKNAPGNVRQWVKQICSDLSASDY